MKMEALKRVPGKRYDEKGAPLVPLSDGMKTRDIVGAENGESREQVRRYIRLNNLIPELLEDVDMGKIAFRPAVELLDAYLKRIFTPTIFTPFSSFTTNAFILL